MTQYYLGTITLGIIMIIVTIVLILMDKKNTADYAAKLEAEKKDLLKIIDESEQMLDELNKFSDYILNQVDKRSVKLGEMLNKFDEKVQPIDNQKKIYNNEQMATPVIAFETAMEEKEERVRVPYDNLNNKHKEVLEMVERGMSDIEIAKALNMGKGEVQLILGMNIHKLRAIK